MYSNPISVSQLILVKTIKDIQSPTQDQTHHPKFHPTDLTLISLEAKSKKRINKISASHDTKSNTEPSQICVNSKT